MVTCFPTRCHPPLTKPNKTFQPFIVLSRDSVFFCRLLDEILINDILIQLICCMEWPPQVLHVPDRPENDEDVITPRTDDHLSPSQIPVASWGFLDWSTILREPTVIAIGESSKSERPFECYPLVLGNIHIQPTTIKDLVVHEFSKAGETCRTCAS